MFRRLFHLRRSFRLPLRYPTNLSARKMSLISPEKFFPAYFRYRSTETGSFEETGGEDNELDLDVRTVIKYNTDDGIINELLNSSSVQDVFNIIEKNRLEKRHLVQTVLVLFHMQVAFARYHIQRGSITDTTLDEYLEHLQDEKFFQNLLCQIAVLAGEFDVDELSCTFLYLSKMNIPLNSPVMQALSSHIESKLKSDPDNVSLAAISRTAVAIRNNGDLSSQLFLLNLIPVVMGKIDRVTTPDDLRLFTICVFHCRQIASTDVLQRYKELCEKFLRDSKLTSDDGKTITKILNFLSVTNWVNDNAALNRKLFSLLKGNIHKMDKKDVVTLHKVFCTLHEPVVIAEELADVGRRYFSVEEPIADKVIHVGLLSTVVSLATHGQKRELEKCIQEELSSEYFSSNILNFYQILRNLKSSNLDIYHAFWRRAADQLQNTEGNIDPGKTLTSAQRYIYFNNNMAGTFRHYPFENVMIDWILDDIENGIGKLVPARLCRGAAFIIAYCKVPSVVAKVMGYVIEIGEQISERDAGLIARCIEIMLDFNRRRGLNPDVMEKLVALDACLNECSWRHLSEKSLGITEITTLLRTFRIRQASPDSLQFRAIVDKLKNCDDPINSRLIRDLAFATSGLNYLLPTLIDKMANYIVDNEDDVLSDTAERVLSNAYTFGYTPKNGDKFFAACARILMRDIERLNCLRIVQMCLSLSFFHAFPRELVNAVFSVQFLERIDEELANCFSRATYPVKVRHVLMELNRSVCLDQPELDVPWFHTKYCEEIQALDPAIRTPFHEEVYERLIDVLGDVNLIQSPVYSPYGYKINFLVLLDERTKPLLKHEHEKAKEKIAFILHSENQFTLGERRLKGQQQLRQRHLEMLGYRVVPIPEFVWNAMYLSDSGAKKMFLSDHIWPER